RARDAARATNLSRRPESPGERGPLPPRASERGGQLGAARASEPGARIPAGLRRVALDRVHAVVAGDDVAQRLRGRARPEFSTAMRPAHSGDTALVPPMGTVWPSTRTRYPVWPSALPQMSGTPRPT